MARRKDKEADEKAELEVRRRLAQAEIRQFPDPVLRSEARTIEEFDEGLVALAERMYALAEDAVGAGLAAPQIGLLRRLIVINFRDDEPWIPMANPEVLRYGKETELGGEGCLSLEYLLRVGHSVEVERSLEIDVRWQDLTGAVVERTLVELDARIFQHEVDHLNGILTFDRAEAETRREAMRRLRERIT